MAQILVIDDEPLSRGFMATCLRRAGHTVIDAGDGAEGLSKLRTTPIDVVVTDIFMPGRDGIEVVRELRSRRPRLPVVAVSGGSRLLGEDFLPTARALGAAATLGKPFSGADLVGIVGSLLPVE